ncbi:MAG: aminopeptidase [Myxococcales bacterium]|nr:aminopeptidase [Myxococcales bacterium]
MTRRRAATGLAGLLAIALVGGGLVFGEQAVWLARAGLHQAELLWGRVPIEDAIAAGHYDEAQVHQLRLVPEIKAFGRDIGLSATENYDTINPTWDRTIYNVSASPPLALENERWWFPVVGSVPYLGFFDEESAEAFGDGLRAEGMDVYVRTAGAYSTLGWFRDPVMPGMLKWPEYQFANTILHELAHATVWVPGSVQFNESFANFVGDEASRRYMLAKYGEGSPEVESMRARIADGDRYRRVMHDVYRDLEALYADPALGDDAKLAQKALVFASLPNRIDGAGFAEPQRWKDALAKRTWNNATMMQFRVYNRSREWFQALYEAEGSDLLRFMHRVPEVTRGASDPYAALAEAVGADPESEAP